MLFEYFFEANDSFRLMLHCGLIDHNVASGHVVLASYSFHSSVSDEFVLASEQLEVTSKEIQVSCITLRTIGQQLDRFSVD
jgi:hypothetical protein